MHREFTLSEHELYIKIYEGGEDPLREPYRKTIDYYREGNYTEFIKSLRPTFKFIEDFGELNGESIDLAAIEDVDGYILDLNYYIIKDYELLDSPEELERLFKIKEEKVSSLS